MATERLRRLSPALASYTAIVTNVIRETSDARTLIVDVGVPGVYRAGQYVTIDPHQFDALRDVVRQLEQQKRRREPPRAYSLCSAPHERTLAITVKEEADVPGETAYPPLLAHFLVHQLRIGDSLEVKGFLGGYTVPDDIESSCDHVLHLCAGSGIVPNMSLIKDSLHRHRRLRHTLLYSNRTWTEVIFRDALTAMARRQPSRLRVVHCLTRETRAQPPGAEVRHGRVDLGLLRHILAAEPASIVYMCGPAVSVWQARASAAKGMTPPPRFIESMQRHLRDLGVPRALIRVETFG